MTLIGEKDYPQITVTEIAERADVARATFYLHYDDKDALLLSVRLPPRAAQPVERAAGRGWHGSEVIVRLGHSSIHSGNHAPCLPYGDASNVRIAVRFEMQSTVQHHDSMALPGQCSSSAWPRAPEAAVA